MPQSLADFAQLHYKLGNETAFVSRRGFRTLRWSYRQVAELAFRVARELESRSIGKGDRVIIYMPTTPEVAIAMLACARIGAVHSVVFGGFSADSIRDLIS